MEATSSANKQVSSLNTEVETEIAATYFATSHPSSLSSGIETELVATCATNQQASSLSPEVEKDTNITCSENQHPFSSRAEVETEMEATCATTQLATSLNPEVGKDMKITCSENQHALSLSAEVETEMEATCATIQLATSLNSEVEKDMKITCSENQHALSSRAEVETEMEATCATIQLAKSLNSEVENDMKITCSENQHALSSRAEVETEMEATCATTQLATSLNPEVEKEFPAACGANRFASCLSQEMEMKMEVDAGAAHMTSGLSFCTTRDSWDTNPVQSKKDRTFNIAIIGASGSGKSTVGNILLGKSHFKISSNTSFFVSETIAAVVGAMERRGKHLKVLDTPDIYGQDLKDESRAMQEITNWREIMGSEPDLILLTIACHMPDPTGDIRRYNRFKRLWGEDSVRRRLVVIFTFGDKLGNNISEHLTGRLPQVFQEILRDAGGRHVVFDNTLDGSEQERRVDQICLLLDKIGTLEEGVVLQAECQTPKSSPRGHLQVSFAPDSPHSVNVLIIGKTGNGKSTVGNVLLNTAAFPVSSGMTSSTFNTETQTAQRDGVKISMTDTPDVINLDLDAGAAAEEIRRWKSFNPDVILLAVRCDVRYTPEEYQIYKQIKSVLGEQYVCSRLTVAFTFGDRQERDLKKELETVCAELKQVLTDAEHRFLTFSEDDEDKRKQKHFFDVINSAKRTRKGILKERVVPQAECQTSKSSPRGHLQVSFVPDSPRRDVYVLIIGKTGNGKSTVGNTLLNTSAFYVSSGLASSTTCIETKTAVRYGVRITDNIPLLAQYRAKIESDVKPMLGRKLRPTLAKNSPTIHGHGVSDTPDVSNLDLDWKTAVAKIREWREINPDVILLAVRCDVRYTPEEFQIYKQIKSVLGEEYVYPRLTVVFTFGDRQERNLETELETVCMELKQVLEDAGNRYLVFKENDQEVANKHILHLMTFVPNPEVEFELKRILLLGPPKSGKSSCGNAIIGRQVFKPGTETSKPISYVAEVDGRWLQVYDTPGIANDVGCLPLEEQLSRLLAVTRPGPHGILLFFRESVATPEDLTLLRKLHDLNIQKYLRTVIVMDKKQNFDVKDILLKIVEENRCQPLWLLEEYSSRDRAIIFTECFKQLFETTAEGYLNIKQLQLSCDVGED